MTLTNTSVPIDTKEVSSLVKTIQGLPLSSMLKIVLLIVVLLILVRLLTGLSVRLIERSHIDKSLHGFLRASVKIALYFVAATIVAGSLHIDVTSLIAVLSVAGLAVSLALQGALSNLASGLVILTTRPLKVGDYVSIGGSEGFVEEIGMTYTKLSAYDKRFFFIPNSTVTSSCVINYTLEGRRRVEHTITASYNCDIDQVKAAITEAVEAIPGFYQDPPVSVHVSSYQDSAIAYLVRALCSNESYWDNYYALLEEIKRSFDRHGIEMTYPHLNVHMVGQCPGKGE